MFHSGVEEEKRRSSLQTDNCWLLVKVNDADISNPRQIKPSLDTSHLYHHRAASHR